jgi:hypothetical protein
MLMAESQYLDRSDVRFRRIPGKRAWKEDIMSIWEAWTAWEVSGEV